MTRRDRARGGFTLIELLVVIAIITVLSALSVAAYSAVRKTQKVRTTDDILFKLQQGIDNQVKILNDQVRADRKNRTAAYSAVLTYCGGDEDRAEALLMYLKLRHAFPQTYAEATANVTLALGGTTYLNWPPHKAYASLPNLSTGWTADQQSAALLFAALSSMAAGGSAFEMEATNSAQLDFMPPTGVTTARVFKDGWNQPVGFKRFYESLELDQPPYTNVKTGKLDPWDPLAKLATPTTGWTALPTLPGQKTTAEAVVFVSGSGAAFNNRNKSITAYSLGSDEAPGGNDDLFGYRLRKLGNRGTR
jgi:prepilin-type N-terminal cleavage/methylation domain-containing protein